MPPRQPQPLTIDLEGCLVKIYRNLNIDKSQGKFWSVEYNNKVVATVPTVKLLGVKFTVSEASRQRVLATCRNVHAKAVGIFTSADLPTATEQVTYSPYVAGHFYRLADDSPIYTANAVLLHDGEVFVSPEPTGLFG